ncbi:B12-binding domain-containing radical SAM protein [Trichloromonas sp.]|uniref:B12-binding domain-containing radical SAM protein n=1 Tax=Trichloromonas sp. TaxID=3069249 RepID=UPI002A418617|nr:radical SAM protein [Trichloromonas sp.]
MKMLLIYPRWPKLERQTEFHLPPHGPVVFAATLPPEVEVEFVDENLETVDFSASSDLVALSVMLSCQLPRAFEIARRFREQGRTVIFGGIAVMLHAEEVALHADAIFLGEAEGRMAAVIEDFRTGRLKPVYDYMNNHPDIHLVGTARRSILNRELYNYRGVQMLDLVHASRGCKFNCFPCCTGYLGGKKFRPRPIDQVIAEMEAIENNRLFIVDNSLAQDRQWLKELFTAMIPLKKKWVSHPILDDPEILKLAADAGAWYVYQAVFDTSDTIRNRIRRLKEYGIGIEGTIILGTDDQDEDAIKRLVDFLMEVELDVAEFTIMTPFPHSPIRAQLERDGRILSNNWLDYSADKVVFQPKRMTPEKLQELFYYAWDTFYANGGYALRMGELFKTVMRREMDDGTYRRYNPRTRRGFHGVRKQA